MQKRVLITGGKGYLGGRLSDYLINTLGFLVSVTSRNGNAIKELPLVNVIQVNTSEDNLVAILKDFDIIIHLAALDAKASVDHPKEAIDVNVGDTVKWLEAASKVELSHFIYFSTVHVYGTDLEGKVTELSRPNPVHPYSITHKCAEDYVLYYGEKGRFKSHVIRLSNGTGFPVGKMNQDHLLVPDLCKSAIMNKKIILKSNPNIKRDFIAISDVVKAVGHFIENTSIKSGIYNISSGKSMTIKAIAQLIKHYSLDTFNVNSEIVFNSNDKSIPKDFEICNNKLLETGFVFQNDYGKEIMGLLNYYKNQAKSND